MKADFDLIAILRIAHQLSLQANGGSIAEALARTKYTVHRAGFDSEDVRLLLVAHPSLVDEWLAYSEDKRTDVGWYVLRDGEIGQIRHPTSQRSYASIQEAVAEFITRELDFYATLAA